MSQIIAARFLSSSTTFSAACVAAMPVAKVTRLPPVRNEKPIELVSPTIGRTFSTGIPRTSAAIIPIEAREPPISGLPDTTTAVPSSLMWQAALELAADVEPEARGDAAALVGPELLLQMRMVLGGLDGLRIADVLPGRAVHRLDAVLRRVLLAQRQRVDAELVGQFVETALDAVGRVRGAGRAIGGDLRAI